MGGRRVADVLGEAPPWVLYVGEVHEAVARDLRDDRGGGDRRAGGIAVDDRTLRVLELGDREPVEQAQDFARTPAVAPRSGITQRRQVGLCSPRASIPRTQRETTTTLVALRMTSG